MKNLTIAGLAFLLLVLAPVSQNAKPKKTEASPKKGKIKDVKKLPVPETHPRICFTAEDIPTIRANIEKDPWSRHWQSVSAVASSARGMDPKDALAHHSSLQVRCLKLTAALECAAFHALVSEDKTAAEELSALLAAFDDKPFHELLDPKMFMPRGEFLEGFATCYDWAYPVLTDAARKNMERILKRHAEINYLGFKLKKSWEATTEANNHSMAAMGAVGLSGLALWYEHDAAQDWATMAAAKADTYFALSFDSKGAAYEGDMYGHFGISRILPFYAAITDYGYVDALSDGRMDSFVEQFVHEIVPGGSMSLPLNDSAGAYRKSSGIHALYAASEYDNPLARWLWEDMYNSFAGGQGHSSPYAVLWEQADAKKEAPKDTVRQSGERGLVTARTGWGEDDFLVSFEAGKRLNGCHSQGDHGHFLIWSQGGWLAADTGYCNNNKEGWPNQTDGHNGMMIDGKGQYISGGGKFCEAEIVKVIQEDSVYLIRTDLSKAYGKKGYNPLKRAFRTMLVLMPPKGADESYHPYVLLLDDFDKNGKEAEYNWMMHGSKTSLFGLGENNFNHLVDQRAMDVHFFFEDKKAVATLDGIKFKSNNFGEHTRLNAKLTAKAWKSITVMAPRLREAPKLKIEQKRRGGTLTISVQRGNVDDEIEWRTGKQLQIKRSIAEKDIEKFKWKLPK